MVKVEEKLDEIEELREKLAKHLCEQESSFKLEECLQIFNAFVDKVLTCEKENEQRRSQEEKAEQKKRQLEETRRAKSKFIHLNNTSMVYVMRAQSERQSVDIFTKLSQLCGHANLVRQPVNNRVYGT
jgi:hypothetical protein